MKNKTKIWITFFIFYSTLAFSQYVPFWVEDFSNTTTNLPPDWATNDLSINSNELKVYWQHCNISSECKPANDDGLITEQFNSSTSENGFLIADPQNYFTNSNPTDAPFQSQIISPEIPLDQGITSLFLEYQSLLGVNITPAHDGTNFSFRFNSGDWISRIIYPKLQVELDYEESENANVFLDDLSDDLPNEATTIQLRWEWTGRNEAFWCIDDIKLMAYNPLEIGSVWNSGGFDGGLNGWTINNPQNDTCGWFWHPFGYYGNALTPNSGNSNDNKFINSPTARNGAMMLNADYCYTHDESPAGNPPPEPILSELISPNIDLSETNNFLVLDFYQVIRSYNNNSSGNPLFSYSYSINSGLTWSEKIALNENLPEMVTLNTHESVTLPEELIGESNVKIKFVFESSLFYWGIDDIRILENPDVDLKISENFYAIPPNIGTPMSQLDSIPFLVDIENIGTESQFDVLVEAGVKNLFTGETIFLDSIYIDEIASFEIKENLLFEKLFLPPTEIAEYEGFYRVHTATDDFFPENNQVKFLFETTENLFKKEEQASIGYKPSDDDNYSWGNSYFIKNGEGLYASQVIFGIENAHQLIGREILIELFEWENNSSDTLLATEDEYTLIGLNTYTIDGTETNPVTYPIVDLATNGNVALKDNTHYFVVIKFEQVAEDKLFFSTSQSNNYRASFTTSLIRNEVRFATMIDIGNEGIFNAVGLGNGFNFVPLVRLVLSEEPSVSQEINIQNYNPLNLFPNPTKNDFYLELPKKINGILSIRDVNGKEFFVQKLSPQDGLKIYLNNKNLTNGVYFVSVISENWQGIERLVVLKD